MHVICSRWLQGGIYIILVFNCNYLNTITILVNSSDHQNAKQRSVILALIAAVTTTSVPHLYYNTHYIYLLTRFLFLILCEINSIIDVTKCWCEHPHFAAILSLVYLLSPTHITIWRLHFLLSTRAKDTFQLYNLFSTATIQRKPCGFFFQ